MTDLNGMHERKIVKKDSTETILTLAANREIQQQSEDRRAAFWSRLKSLFSRGKGS